MAAPLPRVVVMLGLVSLLTDASSEMILPLLPALLLGPLGGSTLVLGLVDGVADALSAVLKLVAGRLSDRSPKKKPFIVAGYGLSTVVRPLISVAMAPWHVVLVRAVDRVGKGLRSAPRDAMLSAAVDKDGAARAFGFHRAMDHAGAVVGPLLAAGVLAAGLDVRQAIQCAWIPGVAAFVVLLLLREPPASTTTTPSTATSTTKDPLPPALRRLLFVCGFFSVVSVADTFLLVRAGQLGVPGPLLPVVWVVLHLAKTTLASQGTRLCFFVGCVVVVVWVMVGVGFGVVVLFLLVVLWVAVVVIGAGHGLREPFEKALVRALAPVGSEGRSFGAYHLAVGLSALPSGLWVGWAWGRPEVGASVTLVASAVGVVVAAALLALVAPRSTRSGE